MQELSKRGQLGGAQSLAIGLVVLVLIVAVGAIVLNDFATSRITNTAGCNSTTVASCGVDYNSSIDGLTGLDNMSNQFGTVGTVAIAAVLIALVIGAFAISRR